MATAPEPPNSANPANRPNPANSADADRYDPAEPFDINRYPPMSLSDLAIAAAVRDLRVPPAPADAWDALLNDFADRTPGRQAALNELRRRTRDCPPPAPDATAWTAVADALHADLTARAAAFEQLSTRLTAAVRTLPVPAPTPEAWSSRASALSEAVRLRQHVSDRLEKITRDEPVRPRQSDPAQVHSDWNALEATLRSGHHDNPPPVPPQRWDSLWNRIQTNIAHTSPVQTPAQSPAPAAPANPANPARLAQPSAETSAQPPTLTLTPKPASAAASTATATTSATASARPLPRAHSRGWGYFYLAAATAALALVVFSLWQRFASPSHDNREHTPGETAHRPADPAHQGLPPGTPKHPAAPQTASLESAEILDMGDVDDSYTSVVRTTSGVNPVTVVVIVSQ